VIKVSPVTDQGDDVPNITFKTMFGHYEFTVLPLD
jgi:hypothetical protein